MMLGSPSETFRTSTGPRRKTSEACDPCRARKLKCDGLLPCKTCEKSKAQCSYDPSTAAHRAAGELDIINSRVLELERAVFGERTYQPRPPESSADIPRQSTQRQTGVDVFENDNGSLSFFGITSTFNMLKSIELHASRAEESNRNLRRPNKRLRTAEVSPLRYSPQIIYSQSDMSSTSGWNWREDVAKEYLDCFFNKVSDTVPVIGLLDFRPISDSFLQEVPSQLPRPGIPNECLLCSVLSLGALYSEAGYKPAEWAANSFARAQTLLGQLFGVECLESVQAAMFMAIYAHHTAQPNLAYSYLGIAIRMAYSIGINENITCPDVTLDHQVALRTWWTLYSLETELCLEYGRPLSIRETDAKAFYPAEYPDTEAKSASKTTFIVVNAKFARIVRKIIDLTSNINERTDALQSFVGRMMNLQAELMTWRAELPVHLAPKDTATVEGLRAWGQVPWMQHQCLDIELRFNHVMLVMHRPFFANITFSTPFYSSVMARSVCIGAARETILLVHKVLEDPGQQRSCYYHRVLAATLVVIASAFDSSGHERAILGDLSPQSVEIFGRMRFGCPAKGLEVAGLLIHLSQLSQSEILSVGI